MAGCTKRHDDNELNSDYYNQIDYRTHKDGGESDDPPIIITHITDMYGLPINEAEVTFIIDEDTSLGFSNLEGVCTLGIGTYGTGNLSVFKATYQDTIVSDLDLVDSLTQIFITMHSI